MTENSRKTFNAIVDRVEGNCVVCEMPYEVMVDIELSKIPFEVKESDHLYLEFDELGNVKTIEKIPKKNIMKRFLKPRFIRFT